MPSPFSFGGEQRVVSVVASSLAKEGHEVSILCDDDEYPINYDLYNLDKSVKIVFMRKRTLFENFERILKGTLKRINRDTNLFKNNLKVLKKFYKSSYYQKVIDDAIKENGYEVIVGVAGYYSELIAQVKSKNVIKVGWQHNSFEAYFRNKKKYYWHQDKLFKDVISKLDEYIVLTNYDKQKLKNEWNVNCITIYNPRSFESKEKSPLNEKCFLAAGRLTYAKGYDKLIKAFKIFNKENKDWKLKIVGNGDQKDYLNKLIIDNKLERFITIDNFTDNIKSYFMNSSALTLSSRWEGMPMIMLESLEMGVPIIAYDIPVVREIIKQDQEGIIANDKSIESYASALKKFAKDEDKIKIMGKYAEEKSKMFSISNILAQWNMLIAKWER